jgi:DNA repair exonuclease SbcCD nuclease subunit
MFKFLHAADIHLDSPLRGLERYEGAPVEALRQATRQALSKMVGLAIEERVAFVLMAGDLYDGDWKDYNTGLFLVREMARLAEANIPVYLIAGNHDAANRMTRSLRLPANVRQLSTEEPETVRLESLGVALHGQGFATQAVTDDLASKYPKADAGCFNIGMLHTCGEGHEGHDRYAPCTLDTLRGKGYHYWALGHVHKRLVLHEEPLIVFPGNIQGRHIRETGSKGCTLVSVDSRLKPTAQHVPLDVLRWEMCEVNASEAEDGYGVVDRFAARLGDILKEADGRQLALRVVVRGASPAHARIAAEPLRWTKEIRAKAIEDGRGQVWVEKVKLETTPPRDYRPTPNGPLGELLAYLRELESDGTKLEGALGELADLRRKLPSELQGDDRLALDTPGGVRTLLEQVRQMLVCRLVEGEMR